jgi:hypothetical protein
LVSVVHSRIAHLQNVLRYILCDNVNVREGGGE